MKAMREIQESEISENIAHRSILRRLLSEVASSFLFPWPYVRIRDEFENVLWSPKEAHQVPQLSKLPLVLESKEANILVDVDHGSGILVIQSEGLEMGSVQWQRAVSIYFSQKKPAICAFQISVGMIVLILLHSWSNAEYSRWRRRSLRNCELRFVRTI